MRATLEGVRPELRRTGCDGGGPTGDGAIRAAQRAAGDERPEQGHTLRGCAFIGAVRLDGRPVEAPFECTGCAIVSDVSKLAPRTQAESVLGRTIARCGASRVRAGCARPTYDRAPAHDATPAGRRHAAAQMPRRLTASGSAASGPHDGPRDRQRPMGEARVRGGDGTGAPPAQRHAYSYTVLRYVHDVVSGERLNVGVLMLAPASRFLKVRTRKTAGRLRQAFPDLDAAAFASAMQAVERGLDALVHQADRAFGDAPTDARTVAVRVVPDDDSALQWSPAGSGLTVDPARTFERLYARYVTRYDVSPAAGGD